MICHKHKCIFIHIPRTAGNSIKRSIRPDWLFKNFKEESHILASTAKKIYKDYWNDYFKFSFVRNPWDRMISMSRFSFYGVKLTQKSINIDGYIEKWPKREVDPRSKSATDTFDSFIKNAVYLNILNEEIDFIGKFENLQNDYAYVCKKLNIPCYILDNYPPHRLEHKHYTEYYDDETKQIIADRYAKDIEYFGYEY